MVASSSVLIAVSSGLLDRDTRVGDPFLWAVGVAAVSGVLVLLMGRLATGPSPRQVAVWGEAAGDPGNPLLAAKLITIEANQQTLLRTEVVLWLQALATVLSLVLLALQIRD